MAVSNAAVQHTTQAWELHPTKTRIVYCKDANRRVAAALQLGFLRLTGTTLSSIEYVSAAVLHHLGSQFGLPAPKSF